MGKSVVRSKKPEQIELDEKIDRLSILEEELLKKELELSTLRIELKSFEARYMTVVGVHYAELDELNALIAELLARQDPENIMAEEHAAYARAQAQASSKTAKDIEEEVREIKSEPSENIKKLFREAAKAMHPDLTMDENVRLLREQYMKEVNQAYEKGDEERMFDIIRRWESCPESIEGEGTGVELIRVIRKISQVDTRLQDIEKEFISLKSSDLWKLKQKVEAADKVGGDLLSIMADEIKTLIAEAQQRLDNIRSIEDS